MVEEVVATNAEEVADLVDAKVPTVLSKTILCGKMDAKGRADETQIAGKDRPVAAIESFSRDRARSQPKEEEQRGETEHGP